MKENDTVMSYNGLYYNGFYNNKLPIVNNNCALAQYELNFFCNQFRDQLDNNIK